MSIQMKNGCLVYYGNLIGYQAKNQTEVTVDPQFRREELESWLARRGLVPRWEEGVYERLSNEGFRVSDSSPELQSCRIWQLKPGTPIQMRFIGLDAMAQKFGGPTPEQYHVVYDGRIQDNDLEKLWNKFSRTPLGPDGQPLAISDVVELYNASGSTFFYIDRYGFQPIEFVDHPSQDQSMSVTLYIQKGGIFPWQPKPRKPRPSRNPLSSRRSPCSMMFASILSVSTATVGLTPR